jgi:hypothetical protein
LGRRPRSGAAAPRLLLCIYYALLVVYLEPQLKSVIDLAISASPPVPWRFDAAAAPTWDSSGLSRGGAVVGYGCYLVNDLYTGLYFEIDYS